MPRFDVTRPQRANGPDWTPLATGQYVMEITKATTGPSKYPNEKDEHPEEMMLEFTLAEWNEEYHKAGYQQNQKVFSHMPPFYGDTKKGPTKLKKFADPFVAVGMLPPQFDPEDFVGIKCRVIVEQYIKAMGPAKGQPGNKVLALLPLLDGEANSAPDAQVKPKGDDLDHGVSDVQPSNHISDAPDRTRADLIAYAQALAVQAGGIWPMQDWTKHSDAFLRSQVAAMEILLTRKQDDQGGDPF